MMGPGCTDVRFARGGAVLARIVWSPAGAISPPSMRLIFRMLSGWAMLKRRMWPVYPAGLAVAVLGGLAGTVGLAAGPAGAAAQAGAAAAHPAAVQGVQARPGMVPVGAAPALPPGARLDGAEPRSATLHVTVALRSAHPAWLDRLATRVATPDSTQFRHFMRPAQVQRRFGPPAAALARARAWLRGQHLVTEPVLADGLLLPVTGSVRQFEAAFRVKIARIRLAGGRLAWANRSAPELPSGLRRWVAAVVGLDSLHVLHPELARGAAPNQVPHLTAQPALSSGGGSVPGPPACRAARTTPHVYTAAWLATAYQFNPLYRAGDFGQHVTVALYELADYANRDIQAYDQCYQISPPISRVRVDGGTSVAANPDGTVEATADIEVVQAMAPQASILVYEAPARDGSAAELDNYGKIAQQDRAQVVSTSWGSCEPANGARLLGIESEIFQEMSVQGQSVLAAAGDDGSADCMPAQNTKVPPDPIFYSLQVDDPGSQPFVTAVGGTEITRFGSPPAQSVWNQTPYGQGFKAPFNGRPGHPARSPGNRVGGGGISRMWTMPAWQVGFDHSSNSSGKPCHAKRGQDCREVPDVSALAAIGTPASPGFRSTRGYVIYGTAGGFGGKGWRTVGGTSLATPLWAALTALADQQRGSHRLGLLSPSLYRIDRTDPKAFTDVVTGNNDYLARGGRYSHHTCRYGGQRGKPCYHATRGYDMAAGLGTPQASYLVAALLRQHSNAGLG
jgi:subtilase family serine protease